MTDTHLLLYRLAELMLEQERHILSVDDLFDDDRIGDYVKSIQIDSPYQQMIFEGVLTESVRDEKLFVSFTVEGYFHYVLGEVIYIKTEGLGPEALMQIVDENKLNGAKEGVEQCLIRDVIAGEFKKLTWLVDQGSKFCDICAKPLAYQFVNPNVKHHGEREYLDLAFSFISNVIDQLFKEPTDHDIVVLELAIKYMEIYQRNSTVSIVYKYIQEKFKPSTLKKAILIVNSLQFADDKSRISVLSNLADMQFTDANNEDLSSFYFYIGSIYRLSGDFDRAVEYQRKALELDLESYGIEHPSTGISCNALGILLFDQGKFDEAAEYYTKSLQIAKKTKGNEHPDISCELNNLGLFDAESGNYESAIKQLTCALQIDLNCFGRYHPSTAITYCNLGTVYFSMSDYVNAILHFETALTIRTRVLGSSNPDTAISYNNLGVVHQHSGNKDLSLTMYMKSFEIFKSCPGYGLHHPLTKRVMGKIDALND
jgi:tetratricopeptide (TPR) repeat protein